MNLLCSPQRTVGTEAELLHYLLQCCLIRNLEPCPKNLAGSLGVNHQFRLSMAGVSTQWRAYPVDFTLRTIILGLGRLLRKLLLPLGNSPKENLVDKGLLQK